MYEDNLPPVEEVPAAHLEGRQLPGGWTVVSKIKQNQGATGGTFSVPYLVENEKGIQAFLKALNFHAALGGSGDVVDNLHAFTEAFKFERDLLSLDSAKFSLDYPNHF